MILVTGGAGYIGSHTCLLLIEAGYDVLVLDNLSNSSLESLHRINDITGYKVPFVKCDVRNKDGLESIFSHYNISSVIHLAGLKSVGNSVKKPLCYFDNNIGGTVSLLQVMEEFDCKNLIFSSSATVYGEPKKVPISESSPPVATNPYGRSKLIVEEILQDLAASDSQWSFGILRYFNPVGAHKSGLIGEDPKGTPNNLMPYITKVAIGELESLKVFGSDYPTVDGTGVRDYIHVVDLARGHLRALEAMLSMKGVMLLNLGTGRGYSVLEVVRSFEKVSGRKIPCKFVERRPGDVAQYFADPTSAEKLLDWRAEYDIDRMCEDAWRWQLMNPKGYQG